MIPLTPVIYLIAREAYHIFLCKTKRNYLVEATYARIIDSRDNPDKSNSIDKILP